MLDSCLLNQVSVLGLEWLGTWVWSLDIVCCSEGHSTEVTAVEWEAASRYPPGQQYAPKYKRVGNDQAGSS